MATDLEQFLAGLDPEHVLEDAYRRADEAINSFPIQSGRITNWNQFTSTMTGFVSHVESRILKLREPVCGSPDFEWGRAARILIKIYGPSGEKAAFEMARTGNEGGLYGTLKAVAMRIAEDLSTNEIASRVDAFRRSCSPEEFLDASNEYLERYGHLLPSEMTEASAARIRERFHRILEKHPKLLQRLRHSSRRREV